MLISIKEPYLKKLVLKEEIRGVKPVTIEFKSQVTGIVGENGIGKSTLMQAIKSHYKQDEFAKRYAQSFFTDLDGVKDISEIERGPEHKIVFIDFIIDQLRTASMFDHDNIHLQMRQQRSSAGEVSLSFFNELESIDNSLIILDEPTTGLSPRLSELLSNFIFNLAFLKKNQILVTTHSERLMKKISNLESLYSMEHMDYVTYDEFIDKHVTEYIKKLEEKQGKA